MTRTVGILFLAATFPLLSLGDQSGAAKCESIEMYGLCDPYVPGTVISLPRNKPTIVLTPWPGSPAEKAGICPGDRILSVNGVSTSENAAPRILKEIASDQPTTVHLTVRRGTTDRELDVPRVRESTLARLSKEQFARSGRLPGIAILAPLNETPSELRQLDRFDDRVDRRNGFKRIEGVPVPARTPEDQVKKLLQLRQSTRFAGTRDFADGSDSFSAGFSALVLTNPDELWVSNVLPGSPAHHGGLLPGDQLLEMNGIALTGQNAQQLRERADLLFKSDGQLDIALKVERAGSAISLALETQKRRDMADLNIDQVVPEAHSRTGDDWILGVGALHSERSLREAIVATVEYPSPAFEAGLHVGDSLLAVNGTAIERIGREELSTVLSPNGPSQIVLTVSRLGKKMTFAVTPVAYSTALAQIGRKPTKFGPAPPDCPDN